MIKVAAYCRVGNASQLCLDAQRETMTNHIRDHADWCNAGCYADLLPSSKLGADSELAKMMADAAARKFQRLVVPSVSSLTRNTLTLLRILDALDGYGIKVEFVQERLTSDNLFHAEALIPPALRKRIR